MNENLIWQHGALKKFMENIELKLFHAIQYYYFKRLNKFGSINSEDFKILA
jgi:hypothetical protein